MIESYIFEMLREKSRVIIPEFGAFLMKQEYKTDNNVTGTFVITFNDFLRFNDGLLIEYIAEGEGISKDTSGRLLTEFVKKMKQEIATNGQYELFQMGILKLDEQKKVIFIQTQDPAAVPYADRLLKPKHSFPSYLEETGFPEEPIAEPLDYFAAQDQEAGAGVPADPNFADAGAGVPADPNFADAGAGVLAEPAFADAGAGVRKENVLTSEVADKAALTEEKEIATTEDADLQDRISYPQSDNTVGKAGSPTAEELKDIEKERTNFGTLVLIIILLVIAAGTALYFGGMINLPFKLPFGSDTTAVVIHSDSDSLDFFAAEPENSITESSFDEDTIADSDTAVTEEIDPDSIVEPLPDEEPQPVREVSNPETNFHYVIGFSIGSQKEADKKVSELKARGFDACIVNQHKGFFRVAYGSYPDRQTAIDAMKALKVSENNPQAWYLYYEKGTADQ